MSHTRIATTSGANNFQFNFIRNSPYYFKTKIAKKMLEKQIDIALIMEITGLTKEEIEKL